MKILYFGSFDKPYDTEVYVSNTLESLGHKVDRQPTTKTTTTKLKELLNNKYDFILLSKGWFPQEEECIQMLKDSPIKKIGWFWDLCWNTPREWLLKEHHLFKADEVFTSDGGDRDWAKYGIKHHTLRQGIYGPEAHKGHYDKKYDYDVVFVGTMVHESAFGWDHRKHLIEFLRKYYGNRFKMFGNDDGVRNEELNNLYATAKVVIGDSVYAPNYWSNRLYETIGRGGFLVFPMIDGIENEFIPYKHFIPYDYYDFANLAEKIDYYIEHPEKRRQIVDDGMAYCIENHTYKKRCEELIKYLDENK